MQVVNLRTDFTYNISRTPSLFVCNEVLIVMFNYNAFYEKLLFKFVQHCKQSGALDISTLTELSGTKIHGTSPLCAVFSGTWTNQTMILLTAT